MTIEVTCGLHHVKSLASDQRLRCEGDVACSFLTLGEALCGHSKRYVARETCGLPIQETQNLSRATPNIE